MNPSRTVLFAPDSFKGSLTSVQVARALADGWLRARPGDTALLCPLADGGEGTLEALAAAGGWAWQASGSMTRSDGRSRLAGFGRRSATRRSSRWPRRPACRAWRPRSRRGRRHLRRDRRGDPGRDRGRRGSRSSSGSAAARRPTAAPACCAAWVPMPTATSRAPISPASMRGSRTWTWRWPATSPIRCSAQRVRPPCTARRRGRRPRMWSSSIGASPFLPMPSRRARAGELATCRVRGPPAASASASLRSPTGFGRSRCNRAWSC